MLILFAAPDASPHCSSCCCAAAAAAEPRHVRLMPALEAAWRAIRQRNCLEKSCVEHPPRNAAVNAVRARESSFISFGAPLPSQLSKHVCLPSHHAHPPTSWMCSPRCQRRSLPHRDRGHRFVSHPAFFPPSSCFPRASAPHQTQHGSRSGHRAHWRAEALHAAGPSRADAVADATATLQRHQHS